ncbi:MAG: ABC transporter ATP-binding protein [Pseudomonadota bacterium]|nr:ABC transporter ATP-binding protein [Pseudomonadota bacterium]
MKDLAIQVEHLGKQYRLGAGGQQHNTLRDAISAGVRSMLRRDSGTGGRRNAFWALSDASFEIERGESVGIIGLNGAGKSTLLKILSRIVEPTTGVARIAGRVGAMLEVGTGFHSELTGRENVYLYGSILGMSKREMDAKFDAIVAFSGITDLIDTPVKRYSSGMYVRLAFAVAAHLQPEILLIDEVLSVGDLPFQRKCMDFAKSMQTGNATILFVSHNMFSIKTMCRRVIYLKQGQVQFDGPTDEGIRHYEDDCSLSTLPWAGRDHDAWPLIIKDCVITDDDDRAKKVFDHGERMKLRLRFETRRPVGKPNFIVAFVRSDGVACCNFSSEVDGAVLDGLDGDGVIELVTPPLKLVAELYTVHVLVREPGFQKVLCAQIGGTFHVRHDTFDTHFGVFHESARWSWDGAGTTPGRSPDAGEPLLPLADALQLAPSGGLE